MKRLFFAAMFSVLSLGAAEVSTPWNKVFESGNLNDSVKWRTRISLGEKDGQKFIQMGKTPKTAGADFGFNLQQVPVEPNTLYKLVITAEVEGPDTIENDPAVIDVLRVSNKKKAGKPLPGWIIMYINDKDRHYASLMPTWSSFCRKGKFDYVHLFYTPEAAKAIIVKCHNYGNLTNLVKFYKFTLEKIDGNIRNVNPDFAPGAYNCSGYTYGGQLWRIVEENGSVLLKCNGSGVMGDPVPVVPGEKFTLTVTGSRSAKSHGSARILFLDSKSKFKGKASKEALAFKSAEFETKSFQFTVPEGVRLLRTSLSRGNFKSVKLIRESN